MQSMALGMQVERIIIYIRVFIKEKLNFNALSALVKCTMGGGGITPISHSLNATVSLEMGRKQNLGEDV